MPAVGFQVSIKPAYTTFYCFTALYSDSYILCPKKYGTKYGHSYNCTEESHDIMSLAVTTGRTMFRENFILSLKVTQDHSRTLLLPVSQRRILPRDAIHKRGLCRHAVSVRLSVTFVYSVKTSKHIF